MERTARETIPTALPGGGVGGWGEAFHDPHRSLGGTVRRRRDGDAAWRPGGFGEREGAPVRCVRAGGRRGASLGV